MTTLFRPVGLNELSLIWDSGMREFPPRLPHQPIFYPVANREYATQIARDWNTKESSFAGYVTKFSVPGSHLAPYEPHTVGSATHVEYWIPAKDLPQFNAAIQGIIDVESGYFGEGFRGFIPDGFGLKGKDVVAQFVAMAKTWDYSRMDFVCEVATNRKAIYLNFLFWSQFDFNTLGIGHQLRDLTIDRLREAWDFNHIGVPLPVGPVLPNHD
jgi:hypothetical protein